MLPAMCRKPPCMNIDVNAVSHVGQLAGVGPVLAFGLQLGAAEFADDRLTACSVCRGA